MIAACVLYAGTRPAQLGKPENDRDQLAEDMEFFDFGTIFFLVAAVVIFFQLRNVLGRRTGSERPPFDPYTAGRARDKGAAPPAGTDNVVSLPNKKRVATAADDESYRSIDAFSV